MNNQIKLLLCFFVVVFTFLYSCKKKEIEYVYKDRAWNEIDSWQESPSSYIVISGFNKVITQAKQFQDKIAFQSLSSIFVIDNSGMNNSTSDVCNNINEQMAIGKDFAVITKFFERGDSNIIIKRHEDFNYFTSFRFNIRKADTSFADFMYIDRSKIFINEYNQLLIPFYPKNTLNHNYNFLLLNVKDTIVFGEKQYKVSSYKKIEIPNSFSIRDIHSIFVHKGNFFFTASYKTIKIDTNGDYYEIFNYSSFCYFYNTNTLGALSYTSSVDETYLNISNDEGRTWNRLTLSENILYSLVNNFVSVQDSFVMFRNEGLYTFSYNNSSWKLRELENDGLQGKVITGISILGNEVYVSTMQGLYKRKLSDFFQSKK